MKRIETSEPCERCGRAFGRMYLEPDGTATGAIVCRPDECRPQTPSVEEQISGIVPDLRDLLRECKDPNALIGLTVQTTFRTEEY